MTQSHGQPALDLLPPVTAPTVLRLDADAVIDAAGVACSPGSLLLALAPAPQAAFGPLRRAQIRVLAAGPRLMVDARSKALGHPADLPHQRVRGILTPAYVNAHTHLDLTHIGPTPHDPKLGFAPFVKLVVFNRRQDDEGIAASVRRGVELSLAGGVVAIGDICGQTRSGPTAAAWRAMAACPVLGVGYLEYFGMGKGELSAIDNMTKVFDTLHQDGSLAAHLPVRVGLQPHAPYSVSLRGYDFASNLAKQFDLPLATHLAETPEERQFIARGDGPKRKMFEDLGIWDDSALEFIGRGKTPVAHLAEHLSRRPMLAVHLNDLSDADIATLALSGATAAYCPRSSEYFGNHDHFGPHRYRDLLAAGVPVALGTDSVINLPPDAGNDTCGMSTLDEARRLFARDQTSPRTLLAMITTSGARALGLNPKAFTFADDAPLAGLVAIASDAAHAGSSGHAGHAPHDGAIQDPARQVMSGHARPRLLMLGT
jgi:cytosine/adenosine deaminase-related metal-dependent hydrolase